MFSNHNLPFLRGASHRAVILSVLLLALPFVSIAAPVRSNLGGGGVDEEATPLYPTDYIQYGLFAYWDGIENESWGMHNPYAESWLDLVGGIPATFRRTTSWDEDALVVLSRSGTCAVSIVDDDLVSVVNGSEFTIEVVRTITDSKGAGYVTWGLFDQTTETWGKGQVDVSSSNYGGSSSGTTWINIGPGYSFVTRSGEYATASTSFVVRGGRLNSYYNGNPKNTKSGLDFSATTRMLLGGAGCRICAIRIYSRALSVGEIIKNYQIDKERFGL